VLGLLAQARIVSFFNPASPLYTTKAIQMSSSGFFANDALSLYQFHHDWHGQYRPKDTYNTAFNSMQSDIGVTTSQGFYIGYFRAVEYETRANRGFTDFYHALKNNTTFAKERFFSLHLELKGSAREGLRISRQWVLKSSSSHKLVLGVGASLFQSDDMQLGFVDGQAVIKPDGNYTMKAKVDYHHQDNQLYDGWDASQSRAWGYGVDFGLHYFYKPFGIGVKFIANNLFSAVQWGRLPYSKIDIQTANKVRDQDNNVVYNPTISGIEKYVSYQQRLPINWSIEIGKNFKNSYNVYLGINRIYRTYLPYVSVERCLSKKHKIAFTYEARFHSIGVVWSHENFSAGIRTDNPLNASALGFSLRYKKSF
jgi:hypothetical protein